jgi:hypothetical protein
VDSSVKCRAFACEDERFAGLADAEVTEIVETDDLSGEYDGHGCRVSRRTVWNRFVSAV